MIKLADVFRSWMPTFRPVDQKVHSHACVACFVDDDSLACLINIVVHAEVGSHTVEQHAVIRSHLRKLFILVAKRKEVVGRNVISILKSGRTANILPVLNIYFHNCYSSEMCSLVQ